MPKKTDRLDSITASHEAVFAIDRNDRLILWTRECEHLLGYAAAAVLGKYCFEVIGGRDVFGNLHCYENCPIIHQARSVPGDEIRRFAFNARTSGGEWRTFAVSAFLLQTTDPSFSVIVHVLKGQAEAISKLELELHFESMRPLEIPRTLSTGETPRGALSPREKEILRCISRGMSTSLIAEALFISPVTVRNHVRSILQKLGVHTKFAAVAVAYQNALV